MDVGGGSHSEWPDKTWKKVACIDTFLARNGGKKAHPIALLGNLTQESASSRIFYGAERGKSWRRLAEILWILVYFHFFLFTLASPQFLKKT